VSKVLRRLHTSPSSSLLPTTTSRSSTTSTTTAGGGNASQSNDTAANGYQNSVFERRFQKVYEDGKDDVRSYPRSTKSNKSRQGSYSSEKNGQGEIFCLTESKLIRKLISNNKELLNFINEIFLEKETVEKTTTEQKETPKEDSDNEVNF
jgi:hypothetical protein